MIKTVLVGSHEVEYDDGELTEGQAKRQFYMANRKAYKHGTRITRNMPFRAVNMGSDDDWRKTLASLKKGGKKA